MKHADLQDPRLLRLFITVADSGGVSAAEHKLHLSRSTISTNLAELESRLGLTLCKRGPGGFALTREGKAVYQAASSWLTAGDQLNTQLASLQHSKLAGELRIGFCDNSLTHPQFCFAQVIAAFRQKAPDARLSVTTLNAAAIANALATGDIHIGLAPAGAERRQFYSKPLYQEQHQLYCANHHSLASSPEVTDEQLTQSDFVGTGEVWSPEHARLLTKLTPSATAPELEARTALILSGCYVGFLPRHAAEPWLDKGELKPLRAHDFNFTVSMAVHCLAQEKSNPLIQQLFSLLNDSHYVQTRQN